MTNKYSFKQVILTKGGFLRGPFGGDLKKEIFVEKGINTYKVYEQGVVLNSNKSIGRYYISEKDYKAKLHKFSVQDKDFLVSCSGVNMGAIYQLKEPFERGIINQALLRIRLNTEVIDDNYFYYLFKELISKKITSGSGDSTIPNFPGLDLIKNIEFELPLKNIQVKIGKILNDLDFKIGINNRINAELESMAKTLYNYWFVQFDFPDENGNPYKSSGGKMVWSKELKREIPEGWKVKKLAEITGVSNESVNPMDYPTKNFKHYSIPGFDSLGTFKVETGENIKSHKFKVEKNDVLVSKLNPWFSRVIYSTDDEDLICSTEFVVWRTSNIAIKNYMYMIARDSSFISYCTQSATGTSNSHKRVNPTVMMDHKIVFDDKIAELFGNNLGSTIKMYAKNQIENNNFAELRDWLLPMLMNGQVTVGNGEEKKNDTTSMIG